MRLELFLFASSLLSIFNARYFRLLAILGYIICMGLVGLGALGIIDKHGPMEHWANEFISMYSGMPLEELETLEGTVNDVGQEIGKKSTGKKVE